MRLHQHEIILYSKLQAYKEFFVEKDNPVFKVIYNATREVIDCIKKHSRIYFIVNHTDDNMNLDDIEQRKVFLKAFMKEYKRMVNEHLECFAAGMLTEHWKEYMANEDDFDESYDYNLDGQKINELFF
jgi:hypothetical protein